MAKLETLRLEVDATNLTEAIQEAVELADSLIAESVEKHLREMAPALAKSVAEQVRKSIQCDWERKG